jgi:hypothetical protein
VGKELAEPYPPQKNPIKIMYNFFFVTRLRLLVLGTGLDGTRIRSGTCR